jgi:hypothetical protein
MDQGTRKSLLIPGEALVHNVQRRAVEQRPPKPQAGGSIPSGPASLYQLGPGAKLGPPAGNSMSRCRTACFTASPRVRTPSFDNTAEI